ncbi:MAG: hypothetical protein R2730_10120 [Chitinophagales bacterium]
MTKTLRCSVLIAMVSLASCVGSQQSNTNPTILRPAENTPEFFVPAEGVSLDQSSCKSPMIDPRDGTQIVMISSIKGKGNYQVYPYKYGLKNGELLRLDCRTGQVIGIVKE